MTTIETTIRELTTGYIESITTIETTRVTYLKVLVEETQRELGAPIRKNNARPHKIAPEETARQLGALSTVHERFSVIVNEVVEKSLADVPAKERVAERNRRSNFARTAVYAVRLYVRAGKDLTALAPAKVSKSTLAVPVAPKTRSPRRLRTRVERASKAFVTALLELSESDKTAAIAELDTLIGIMANQLAALGVPMASDAKHAAAEHRPFQQGSTLFVPTQTTIIRQRANPS